MKMSLFRYTFKSLFFFALWIWTGDSAVAQNIDSLARVKSDSISVTNDQNIQSNDTVNSKVNYPLFSEIGFVIDYGKLLMMASDIESKREIGIEIGLKKSLFLRTEFGNSQLIPNKAYTNTNYQSKGSYYRLGIGYRKPMSAKTSMGLSLGYAKANFSDSGNIMIESTSGLFDSVSESFDRNGLSAQWYEIVFHSESKVKKNLYAGFYFRVRIMDMYDVQSPVDVYTIPGYGRTFDTSVPAFNLYLKYKLDLTSN